MIEQLVPSLELCQRAHGLGWEKETCFVWYERYTRQGCVWELYVNPTNLVRYSAIPAPTLQEVLEELPKQINIGDDKVFLMVDCSTNHYEIGYWYDFQDGLSRSAIFCLDSNPAQAALELWCELEKEGEQ